MNYQELISVIIPTYNDADYLKVAIESIQNQTHTNIEIIVVDDYSTDSTKEIAQALAQEDSRLKYYLNEYKDPKRFNKYGININAGYSARNFGLQKAHGDWVTFQDGDDLSFLNRLEIQLHLAKQYNTSHLTSQVIWLEDKFIGKKFDFDSYQKEFDIEQTLVRNEAIFNKAKDGIGVLSKILPAHLLSKIPFELKCKKYFNKLFFGHQEPYIGAAGPTFFKRKMIEKVLFRQLDDRIWPSLKGRGADRDFNYNLAYTFKDSLFVDIPLYCWRTPTKFTDNYSIERFLK